LAAKLRQCFIRMSGVLPKMSYTRAASCVAAEA
jgi:hypothetical protein